MSLSKPKDIRNSWLQSMRQDGCASSLSSDDDVSSLQSLPSMGCNCCSHEIICGTCPDTTNTNSILFGKIDETKPELLKCCLSGCLNKIGEKDLVYEHIKK